MTSLRSTNAIELRFDNLDNYTVVTEVLELVNTRFIAISSIQEVILEMMKLVLRY